MQNEPLWFVRKGNQDMAVVVNFPDKPIRIPHYRSVWNFGARLFDFNRDGFGMVGHTGVILVDGVSGDLFYFDLGRYDDREDLIGPRPEFYSTVRSARHVPQLELKLKARFQNGWIANLDTILIHLGAKDLFKSYGRMEVAQIFHLNLEKMVHKARSVEDIPYHYYGAPVHQYCTRFVREVIRAGGGSFGFTVFTGTQTVKHVKKFWPQE